MDYEPHEPGRDRFVLAKRAVSELQNATNATCAGLSIGIVSCRRFTRMQGHTYAVFVMHQTARALFYFHASLLGKDQSLQFLYAVKFYEVHSVVVESPGFDWGGYDSGTCPASS